VRASRGALGSGEDAVYYAVARAVPASTPDSVANSVTGDIDIRVKVAMDDWTPAAVVDCLITKIASVTQISYLFRVDSSGKLRLTWSSNGTSVTADRDLLSTVATGFVDGSLHWVRTTLDVDNGAAGSSAKFYTSDDGVAWVQLGATVNSIVTSIFDSTSQVEIGTQQLGTTFPMHGKIFYAEIRDGIDGGVVLTFDPEDGLSGALSFDSSRTGETYTINQSGTPSAEIVRHADGRELHAPAANVVVGLPYSARWKSTKLAYAAQNGSALNQHKTLDHLGVILDRTHHKGIQYGPDFDSLSDLPAVEDGAEVAVDTIHQHYDKEQFEFDGVWGTDSRLCLFAQAPRNCNILAATMPIEERSKT
jgi:hypothetical protein